MESSYAEPPPPSSIGRYIDLNILGRGGMGVVYSGYDPELDRAVAIKVMLHSTPDFVARFRREAQAIARLTHGNVVQVYDFGVDELTNPFFVMELVAGTPLDKMLIERGRLPPAQVCDIARQAAQGLAAAHRAGIIHRDVKPSNLIVDGRGNVKIVDFGIARASSGAQLTQAAALMGTPGYMAPEQAQGKTVDSRADVYALGLTMFEMLTGAAPFFAEDPIALVVMNMQQPLPDLRQRGNFPPELVRLVEQMAEKDPDARPQSCDAVARALESISEGAPADFSKPSLAMQVSNDPVSPSVPPTNVYHVPAPPEPAKNRMAIGVAAALATAGLGIAAVVAFGHKPPPVVTPQVVIEAPQTVTPIAEPPKTNEFAMKPPTVSHTGPLRIAVLRFSNVSKDPKLDALAEGIGETAIDGLFERAKGKFELVERKDLDSDIVEIDRGDDAHFDKSTVAMKGRLKGIDVAVQGGYQRSGNVVRATARFVRVETGEIIGVAKIDGRAPNILKLQDELAAKLEDHVIQIVDQEKAKEKP
ncbi:MAG: serine/threonine-protein kinase [Polyangia bacterium]